MSHQFPYPKQFKNWVDWAERLIQVQPPHRASGTVEVLASIGSVGTHTGNTTRTRVRRITLPSGTFAPNSTLEIWVGARISAVSVGTWRVEIELGGTIVGQWQVNTPIRSMYHGRFIHLLNSLTSQSMAEVNSQVDMDSTVDRLNIALNLALETNLDVYVKLNDAGDTGKTISVYGLLARVSGTE